MLFILLHIVFSSFFILCIRWVQRRGEDVVTVGAINYIVAAVLATVWFLGFAEPRVTANSVLTGSIGGVFYFVAFFFLIATASWKGAASTSVVSRLSILVPMAYGVIFWHERPGLLQTSGILLACASLALVGRRGTDLQDGKQPRYAMLLLAAFFIAGGCCRLAPEMFKYLCQPDEKVTFVLLIFAISGAASAVLMAGRRLVPKKSELLAGVALGTANLTQSFCIVLALESLDGYVVFPMTAAGSLIFTTAIAVLFLDERLTRLSYAGVGLAVCALGFLNPGQ